MIEFQISTKHTGTRRVVKVMLYDTVKELRAANRKYHGYYGLEIPDHNYANTGAVCNCITLYDVDKGIDTNVRPVITIRLSRDNLKYRATEIISHESTHAALYLFQHDVSKTMIHEDDGSSMDQEEILCYLVGDITRKVVNKMYEKGVM